MFQPASKIRKTYEVSRSTLALWGDRDRIRVRRLGDGGKRLYHVRDIERELGETRPDREKKKVIYARVSSSKQSEDLRRQVETLQSSYPEHETYKDIGSGLNFKRKRFEALLEQIHLGNVQEVVVSYRDRICRYGFELFESVCRFNGTKIVVHNSPEGKDCQQELADDLLAICKFFVARNNGRRSRSRKPGTNKAKKRKVEEDKAEPLEGVEGRPEQVDGNLEVGLQQVPGSRQEEKVPCEQGRFQGQGRVWAQPRGGQEEDGKEEKEEGKEQGKLDTGEKAF